MKYSNEFINQLIEQEVNFSNHIASLYHYSDNITHLLYIIIPAFILKYGTQYKSLIEECFLNVPIIINDKQDQVYQAFYFSYPTLEKNEYKTSNGIVLNNYQNIGLMQLLDNLVHEFNHAVNSLQKSLLINGEVKIRTGLIYNYFDKESLKPIKKGEEDILEEVINTRQTENIIDIIKSFSTYDINNTIVKNTLYSIYHAVDSNYRSNSYLLETTVCQRLLNNKTFLSTMETLRFEGQLQDIHHFFDSIVGKEGSLLELAKCSKESLQLQKELSKTKWFKNIKINKLKKVNQKAIKIVEEFDQNTVYK